ITAAALLLLQQCCGILHFSYDDIMQNAELRDGCFYGEVYKASWNKSGDYILKSGKIKILIRGTYLSDKTKELLESRNYISADTEIVIPEEAGNFHEFEMTEYLAAKDIDGTIYPDDDDI
ncbi:MAG: hypothetical protein IJZ90_01230, partial [Clostridia bacterium]|nr:hypothetical protein [Clostridia bacterium]